MKLFIDPADMKAKYGQSPRGLKSLMDAWADGINHYLAAHPGVKPKVIAHFEPWMALSFTEGSIGATSRRSGPLLSAISAFVSRHRRTPPESWICLDSSGECELDAEVDDV